MREVLVMGPGSAGSVFVVTSGSTFAGILKSALRRRSSLPKAPNLSGFLEGIRTKDSTQARVPQPKEKPSDEGLVIGKFKVF